MTARSRQDARYTSVAILLHWLMAAGIGALVAIGLLMTHAALPPGRVFALYQLHKSIGITVLAAAVLRILWRLSHRPPDLPSGLPRLERQAAGGTHRLLYAAMIGLPLTGWALVSVSPLDIPTVLYGVSPGPTSLGSRTSAVRRRWQMHWGGSTPSVPGR